MKIQKWSPSEIDNLITDFHQLIENKPNINWKMICEKYRRNKSKIVSKLQCMGFRWKGGIKYKINENTFQIIDSEQKAYWYGFIFADGSIQRNKKNGHLSINLGIKDKSHLDFQ